jgi:lipoprotein Spr
MIQRSLFTGGSIAFLLIFTGCMEPSVRYSRDSDGTMHIMVPSDWDYRANYKVPEQRLKKIAESYIGTKYKSGGMSRKGLDCSGFVCIVFKELNRAALPRSSGRQWKLGNQVSPDDGRAGDLVFFRGGFWGGINHVGIFMGGNTFIHASSSNGVVYDNLDEEYYKKHFAGIRRIF